jgi:hypothetical protein
MRIKTITDRYRYDFSAVMVCEHCAHEQTLTAGYDDDYYHRHVIPAMTCGACGKNRAGAIPEIRNDNG